MSSSKKLPESSGSEEVNQDLRNTILQIREEIALYRLKCDHLKAMVEVTRREYTEALQTLDPDAPDYAMQKLLAESKCKARISYITDKLDEYGSVIQYYEANLGLDTDELESHGGTEDERPGSRPN